MWTLRNRTPYAVGRTWGRDRDGIHQWIIAVKASFDWDADGRLRRSDRQVLPLIASEYHGDPGASSLRYAAELTEPKPLTDVLVQGVAHAPGQRASTEFHVAFRLGTLQKALVVRGDRTWLDGPWGARPSAAMPVTQVPIVYERCFGGQDLTSDDPTRHVYDPRNPVGCGLAPAGRDRSGQQLPNFEFPNGKVEKTGPAGFGPIDVHWSPRREAMGTYDDAWRARRAPLLAEDWHPRSLQCAPLDQQARDPLRGGEPVDLFNLTASGRVRFDLPSADFVFSTHIAGRGVEDHGAHLSTVMLEPERSRLTMVWTTALSYRGVPEDLDRTTIHETFAAP